MRKFLLFILLFSAVQSFAQDELNLSEAFLKSVQEKKFSVLKPWVGPNTKSLQEKWQQVVDNSHRDGFDIKSIKIDRIIAAKQVPNLPAKFFIAVYQYDGKEWDDLLLLVSKEKKIKLVDIPLSSYMFGLNEDRRGKNLRDAEKH